MCGFVGFCTDKKINSYDIKTLKSMNNIIIHRGPDSCGLYKSNNSILGFRRLSIIDLSEGSQPFSDDNKDYTLVFNGEIYNYKILKKELEEKGIVFKTNTEAEVILNSYKLYGKSFVKNLRGMFAFAIWDNLNKKLFCARDPFGIKPFYYIEKNNKFYFSSELKCLLYANICDLNLDEKSLHDYLTFQFVPEPNTMFNDIKILNSGFTLEKSLNSNCILEKYWQPQFHIQNKTQDEKIKAIRSVLEDSVSNHMQSDVPIGCFLSGGIDSTIITLLSKKINPKIKTFTVGFDVNGYSEINYAKETASSLNVENISKTVNSSEFIKDIYKIIWHMDSPVADPSLIPIYYISKEARKYVKVILSGEGSDELFGGYRIYHEPSSLKVFSYMPNSLKRILKHIANICPEGVKGKSFIERGCSSIEERYVGNAKIFKDNEKQYYLKNYNKLFKYTTVTKPLFADALNYDMITKMQYIDINTWLKGDILIKSDRMSMANSLELRVPFLDKEVFNIASCLSPSDKIQKGTTKFLLREAFKDDLPKDIVSRQKLGYPVPIRCWLKDELYTWARNIILNSQTDDFINKKAILDLLEKHRTGSIDYSRKIWTILTFMLWYKIFIEDAQNNQYFLSENEKASS